ncbi:MAG: alkaline phosphatase family protein [Vicinamibacterales bacterium]
MDENVRVRYLRMFSNSVAVGALATCYVLLVFWQLNPHLRLEAGDLLPLVAVVGPYYLLTLTAVCYVLLVVRQLLGRDPVSPGWVSVRLLTALSTLAAASGAVLTWVNIRSFALVLHPEVVRAMTITALTFALAAVAFLLTALWHRRADPAHRSLRALALAALAATSVAVPVAVTEERREAADAAPIVHNAEARQLPQADRTANVTILAVDAGSLEIVTSAAAEGRLPNFGRLLDSGSVMDLATLRPTAVESVWTAVATGKLPQKNGIHSPALYRLGGSGRVLRLLPDFTFANGLVRFGFVFAEGHTSASIAARTIWSILNTHGVSVGVVNWPLTYPAPAVRGFVVTDMQVRLAMSPLAVEAPRLLHPPQVRNRALALIRDATYLPDVVSPLPGPLFTERHRLPARIDRIHGQLAENLRAGAPPQVTMVRYESLDPIGHDFLRYTMPLSFGNVTEDDRRRYGSILESHYGIVDDAIGRAIDRLGPNDLLLVVSGYGMEPLSTGKRLVEQIIGDPEISGTHENAPDGFLMAYGARVEPSRHLTRASIVDVVPTVLYFLGLPVARDMDGFARTALFKPEFTSERPITYIPSYER